MTTKRLDLRPGALGAVSSQRLALCKGQVGRLRSPRGSGVTSLERVGPAGDMPVATLSFSPSAHCFTAAPLGSFPLVGQAGPEVLL